MTDKMTKEEFCTTARALLEQTLAVLPDDLHGVELNMNKGVVACVNGNRRNFSFDGSRTFTITYRPSTGAPVATVGDSP